MCREGVNPNSHESFATIVTTLCYMHIFLVRKPLSLRHTQELEKDTNRSRRYYVPQVAPTAESLCNRSTTATQPQGLRKSALTTALVFVRNAKVCRVLLDSGSELSYISERCVQALGLAHWTCSQGSLITQ